MKKIKLIYPTLSYKIVGYCFDIYNQLGFGYREKYYQKALEKILKINNINYKKELPARINFKKEFLTTNYLDFLIDDKMIIEIKTQKRFLKSNIEQIYNYLKMTNKKLGILINFTNKGIFFKRILNIK